jgi:Bacterial Ig-like domain (group 3)/NHL repeat
VLEQRALLSGLPTLTALIASTASAAYGQSVTFTATVSDLSAGGATPTGGTVTFSDQSGPIGFGILVDGVASFTSSGLPSGTVTVTASYGGTADFAPSDTGTIVTFAGNGIAGYTGNNGPAIDAELNGPDFSIVDSAGNLFFADYYNNVVREVVKATGDIITIAGNGSAGYSGDNGPATAAELHGPDGVTFDSAGDLFIADSGNNVVREVVKATGDIITVAGDGTAGYNGDNGPATAAELNFPRTVAVDSAGDLFIADTDNNRIREVIRSTGVIITVAGNGTAGYNGDNGPASVAELNHPFFVALDPAGDLLIADTDNNRIREVIRSTGVIFTVAGNGSASYSGDGGPATVAGLGDPHGVAFDSAGNLFIVEQSYNVVREVVKATGDIITVAGDGTAGYSGDNGPATAAELDNPYRVAVDSAGDLFIADGSNNVIREVTPAVTVRISPGGPIGGTTPTRTVLTAQPKPANLGRPVTLTATVKDLKHRGPTPIGSVTFLDGTAILGTAALRHGKASLKTSSLPLGPNTIQAYYIPGQGFAPSTASVVENVRAHRSRSKAVPAAETR